MQKYLTNSLVLFSLCIIMYGCAPSLQITPDIVTKIYDEGGTNYCYVSVTNTSSTDQCEFALESPTQYLKLVSVTPPLNNYVLQPLEPVVIKYQITGNPSILCSGGASSCIFDKIRMMARWTNSEEHDEVSVQWSNPVVQSDCWVTDGGANGNNYLGGLCEHPQPNKATTSTIYQKIEDITNPNSFAIDILIDNRTHSEICLNTSYIYGDLGGIWTTIQPHDSYPYGSHIRGEFGGNMSQCSLANNGAIAIHSTHFVFQDANGAKWIPIKIDFSQ